MPATKKSSEENISDTFDRYADMLKAFGSYVRGEKENPYSAEYELLLFETVLKCCGM